MNRIQFILIITISVISLSVRSQDLPESRVVPCTSSTSAGTLCTCQIAELHPTQMCVGLIEVKNKENAFQGLNSNDRMDYLKKHPEPTVIGTGAKLYITDHHHLARALSDLGVESTYCNILTNDSNLDLESFWQKMDRDHLVYAYDENGHGPLPYTSLPNDVTGLKDDIYRSLAAAVSDARGYDHSTIPFADFQWANYFRTRISLNELEHNFNQATQDALQLAHSDSARGLPGYRAP